MAVRAPPDRPVVQAIALADRKVVDAGNAASHQAAIVKLPILVPERPKPVAAVVMPLIGETYRDAVLAEAPQLFDQAVLQFAIPFTCQKGRDLFAAANKIGTVSPLAFQCVAKRHALGIAAVPGILGYTNLLHGGIDGSEGRQGRTFGFHRESPLWTTGCGGTDLRIGTRGPLR